MLAVAGILLVEAVGNGPLVDSTLQSCVPPLYSLAQNDAQISPCSPQAGRSKKHMRAYLTAMPHRYA